MHVSARAGLSAYAGVFVCVCAFVSPVFREILKKQNIFSPLAECGLWTKCTSWSAFSKRVSCGCILWLLVKGCLAQAVPFLRSISTWRLLAAVEAAFHSQSFLLDKIRLFISSAWSACQKLRAGNARLLSSFSLTRLLHKNKWWELANNARKSNDTAAVFNSLSHLYVTISVKMLSLLVVTSMLRVMHSIAVYCHYVRLEDKYNNIVICCHSG